MTKSTKQILIEARDLIVKGWTKKAFARDASGSEIGYLDSNATCFCAEGAILKSRSGHWINHYNQPHDCLLRAIRKKSSPRSIARLPQRNVMDDPRGSRDDPTQQGQLTMRHHPEKICECFGTSGFHASTHHDHAGRERCDMCGWPLHRRWRVRLVLVWRLLWVGAFWDRRDRKLYVLPIPCVGIVFNFGDNP